MDDSSAARSAATLIKTLQKALAPLPSRSALKQDVLYLMVDLPQQGLFSRSMVLQRVAGQLEGAPVQGVSQLVVYGRLQGETQPQWKKVFYLSSGKSGADATEIVLPGTKISEIKVLDAQKPVVDPDARPDRKVKTLEAPLPKTQKERGSGPDPNQSPHASAQAQAGIPTSPSTTAPARPSSPISLPVNVQALGQQLHQPTLRPFLGGALALSLLLGAGLVVHSFRQPDVPARARSLGVGIPLLLLAAGGGWLGWKGWRAVNTFKREGSSDPLAEGLSFLQANQVPEAVERFQEALSLTQGSAQVEIHSLLGQAWAEKGNWAEALAQQQKALGLDPHFSQAHLCIAQIRLKLGQWDEAIDSCWAALELDDRLGSAHYLMGQALMRKGQLKAAIAAFQTALNLDLDPELAAAVRVDLGLAMVHAGRLAQAGQEFSQVLLSGSSSKLQQGRAYYGLGLVLAAQEQHSEAIKSYQRALGLVPSLPEAVAAIGLSYLGQKHRDASGRKFVWPQQVQEAVQQFEQALREDPDLPEAHFGLGEVARIKGDLSSAVASYQRAIRSNGSYGMAHYRLGSVLARQGKLEQAVEHLRSALEISPNFPEAKGSLQQLLSKQTEEVHTDLLPV
ncbi:tetratricopeptide repeat protein [Synechococcus sp. H60.3]|uniref:tetratricopeptide repeat protein n=1 Tax=Synechococcus sp. H60.3 TaxID=2967124 RepID=UPI0039C42D69